MRQEVGADCVVKVEESCVVPTHSPDLSDNVKTRTEQKKVSKNPNSADAVENVMLQHTDRAKCCSLSSQENNFLQGHKNCPLLSTENMYGLNSCMIPQDLLL